MPVFRARPRVVEAFLFNGQNSTTAGLPQWYLDEILAGRLRLGPKQNSIDTPNGPTNLNVGDWIVREAHGLVVMRKDLFDQAYEPIPAGDIVQPDSVAPAPSAPEPVREGVDWPIKGSVG